MRAVSVRLEKHKAAKKVEMMIGNARVHPGLGQRAQGVGSRTVGDGGRVSDSGRWGRRLASRGRGAGEGAGGGRGGGSPH